MKFSALTIGIITALSKQLATAQVTRTAKSSKASGSLQQQIDLLMKQVNEQEKQISDLEKLVNKHPVDATCADNEARIMELAQGLPNGCTLAASPSLTNDYRLVCTETGSIQIHLPDMCNATMVLVGGGGSGGNSPETTKTPLSQVSGGGGAGGVITRQEAVIGDGLYVVTVGTGGVTDTRARSGDGGDTNFRLTMRQSLTDATYAGEEIVAFGGGRGGGVNLGSQTRGFLPCSFPNDGGSGGGGVPNVDGVCNYNVNQDGGITIGDSQGNDGGYGDSFCSGGGGGAGTPGVPGNLNTGTSKCEGGEGGDGIYLGDIVGTDYGVPGGWFAGGGAASLSLSTAGGAKGGGGYFGGGNKQGKPNTGGGGKGCYGGSNYGGTCEFKTIGGNVSTETWGSRGGSGVFFIVFDKCPCTQ